MDSESIQFTDLNDDCLLEVFENCTIESLVALGDCCSHFRELIELNCYPKINSYECTLELTDQLASTCSDIIQHGKKFSKIGRFIDSLSIEIQPNLMMDDDDVEKVHKLIAKLFNHFGENVDDNINEMEISIGMFDVVWFNELRPLGRNVRSLKFLIGDSAIMYDLGINLIPMFPHIERLHIQGDVLNITNEENYAMPSLRSLIMGDNEFFGEEIFIALMQQNPQVEQARISLFNANLQIADLCRYWQNLIDLTIFMPYSDLRDETVHHLQKLKKLRSLTIKRIYSSDFNGIIAGLPMLTSLRILKLQIDEDAYEEFEPHYHHLIEISKKMKSLEEFHISNCPLTKSVCLDFVEQAKSLKEFHFHECDLTDTEEFSNELSCDGNEQLKIVSDENCGTGCTLLNQRFFID